MKTKSLFPLIVLSVLSIGAAATASLALPGEGREQQDRPRFYAKRIVDGDNVKNAEEILGEPDGRCAEIGVGGSLVILMEERIFPSLMYDDGLVVLPEDARFNVEGWFQMSGTEKPPQYAWMPMIRGQAPRGFRLAFMNAIEGSAGVNMIRISNDDSKPILVDAVVGYVRPQRDEGDE